MSHDSYLSGRHPLATVAQDMCQDAHQCPPGARIGGVACGRHWEAAIRADATVAEEEELPDLSGEDLVDEVAVARAVAGEPVSLSTSERREVVRRLWHAGMGVSAISRRLRMSGEAVHAALAGAHRLTPEPVAEVEPIQHGYRAEQRLRIPPCPACVAAYRSWRERRVA